MGNLRSKSNSISERGGSPGSSVCRGTLGFSFSKDVIFLCLPHKVSLVFRSGTSFPSPCKHEVRSHINLLLFSFKSCPILRDPINCSLPGSSVHGISQARVLELVALSFSRGIFLTQGLNPYLLSTTITYHFHSLANMRGDPTQTNGLPRWLSGKESTCKSGASGDLGLIPGLGRSPGEGNGNRLQHSS